jgi:hypothetical protein
MSFKTTTSNPGPTITPKTEKDSVNKNSNIESGNGSDVDSEE